LAALLPQVLVTGKSELRPSFVRCAWQAARLATLGGITYHSGGGGGGDGGRC
jgi:hypothetical protein